MQASRRINPAKDIEKIKGSTAQFGKRPQREILPQDKVWAAQEYFVYFKLPKLQDWGKRSAEARRRNCVVLPKNYLSRYQPMLL